MKTVLSFVLVLAATVAAYAQPGGGRGQGGGGFGGGTSRMALLNIEAIQKELGLTEDQVAAIKKLRDESRPMRGGRGEGGERRRPRGNGDEARAATARWYFVQDEQPRQRGQLSEEDRARFRAQAEERAKKEKDELAKILKPEQVKRLREIYIQVAGTSALSDSEVAAELKITDEQKQKISKAREESFAGMRELFTGGGDREAARTKMEEMRKKADASVLAVLTEDQKKQFEEMKGKKFDLPEGALRGGRQGGRPAQNN